MAFNLQGAVQAARTLPGGSSQHICAKYVRTFLEYGGMNTSGRPRFAREYVGYLPKIGFQMVSHLGTLDAQTLYTKNQAQPGDIAVYKKPGAPGEPGHICMWNGQQWVSDFRQQHMSVYRSRGNVDAYIYRYTGEIDNNPVIIDPSMIAPAGGGSISFDGGFSELNTQTLAAQCPEEIEFKGMWMRYQLRLGFRSETMKNFMGGPGASFADVPFTGELAELSGSDAVEKACQLIAYEECGVDYNQPLDEKFLRGIQLKGEGFKTYGWGQVYNWNGTKKLQDIKPVWTEAELREEFLKTVTREIAQAKTIGFDFTDNQLAVIAHRCHFGLAAFNDLARRMKALGRIPSAEEYRDMALAYCRRCSNWDLYGKGWTNGVNREASHWC